MTAPSQPPSQPPEISQKGITTAQAIKRALWWLTAATVVLYLLVGGLVLQTRSAADKNTRALCALRHDLKQRADSSAAFLVEHPNGVPDIPAKIIQDGIDNQRRTIKALSIISC